VIKTREQRPDEISRAVVRPSSAVQRLSSAAGHAESRSGRIGLISPGMKQMGERSAGNPHAAFDVEGTGDVAWSR
jgi:hypothetical protein